MECISKHQLGLYDGVGGVLVSPDRAAGQKSEWFAYYVLADCVIYEFKEAGNPC